VNTQNRATNNNRLFMYLCAYVFIGFCCWASVTVFRHECKTRYKRGCLVHCRCARSRNKVNTPPPPSLYLSTSSLTMIEYTPRRTGTKCELWERNPKKDDQPLSATPAGPLGGKRKPLFALLYDFYSLFSPPSISPFIHIITSPNKNNKRKKIIWQKKQITTKIEKNSV
jgi:hypothetical protein